MVGPLSATFGPCPEPESLCRRWRSLEVRADGSAFLSWEWAEARIACFGRPDWLGAVHEGDRLVGLCLLGWRPGRPLDLLRRPSLHLNETGDPACDGVMVEYNGVLAERGYEAEALAAILSALCDQAQPRWREILLSGVDPAVAEACARLGLGCREISRSPAPFHAFGPGDPLDGLSRNTRQQISRCLRLYGERGPLVLERAETAAQAWEWLDGLEALHTPYWQSKGRSGAFANPHFAAFHRRLAETGTASGLVDLLRVRAGEGVVGYLYNFRHGATAYSYQSGFAYEEDPRMKPGLACHLLAMRRYHQAGLAAYRLLAGDSRYKGSLSNGRDELVWLAVHRNGPAHRLEALLRALRP